MDTDTASDDKLAAYEKWLLSQNPINEEQARALYHAQRELARRKFFREKTS